MQLETIIGLEVHAQIATKSKLFCACTQDTHDSAPNTAICPVCTGQPGALPVPNRLAIDKAAIASLALNCTIAPITKFDRKNYFYPDLPLGYQISQFDEPLGANGYLDITLENGETRRIRINRLHVENDAGKLSHTDTRSLIDFNRAGCGLMEIVTEPDIHTAEEAKVYAETLRQILQYVGASNADMYRGEMRFDASVSLRPVGETKLYPRSEIKNLNSFRSLFDAINYEIKRQTKLWDVGTPQTQQNTMGYSDEKGQTYVLREKESAADYRYFPEPDIPPLTFTPEAIEAYRKSIPELPTAKRERFMSEYGLNEADALQLTSDIALAHYFEEAVTASKDITRAKKVSNWLLSELTGLMKEHGVSLDNQNVTAAMLGQLVRLIEEGSISGKIAKDVLPIMWETGNSPEKIVEEKGWKVVSDTGAITAFVDDVIANNPDVVALYKGGKQQSFGFLVGQVMKASGGQASPTDVNRILKEKLG